jgi:Ca-activated chloride channel family protein
MRGLTPLAILTVALATGPALAQDEATPREESFHVAILEPTSNTPVAGEIDFIVNVYPPDVAIDRVIFLMDGRTVGERTEPPYQIRVETGDDFDSRVFGAVVYSMEGIEPRRIEVRTPELQIDEEVGVELQQLYVTVLRGGRRVLDLSENDFSIRDDGDPQELVTFARGDVPLTAALVLDSSESMRGERLEAALTGAKVFVSGMRELDEAAVYLFSNGLLRATDFSADRGVLEAALDRVEARGNTALNDHLYLALKRLDTRQGRRVVLLLSDGADVHSVLGMKDVLWKAQRSQAMIYWIRLEDEGPHQGASFNSSWRNYVENEEEYALLEQSIEHSGGRIVSVGRAADVPAAFSEILSELREQYVLGYYPSNIRNDGSWHNIRVAARNSDSVRARNGYIDF